MAKKLSPFRGMTVRRKMMLVFALIALFSTFMTLIATYFINRSQMEDQEKKSTVQLLAALDGNLSLMIGHVEEASNMLFLNQSVQNLLRRSAPGGPDMEARSLITDSLINLMLSDDSICSVILCDNFGTTYDCKRNTIEPKESISVTEQPWYREAVRRDGDFLFVMDADVVKNPSPKNRILSIVRVVKDRMDYKGLGVLIINIDETSVRRLFNEATGGTDARFYVSDGKRILFRPADDAEGSEARLLDLSADGEIHFIKDAQGKKRIVAGIGSKVEGWRIIGQVPKVDVSGESVVRSSVLLVVADLVFLMLCGVYITLVLIRPLRFIQAHIRGQKGGTLRRMPVEEGRRDEITEIKVAYNSMQSSIEELIGKVHEEERIIVKNEVALIQAQVRPHFLYNTLDAISALALEQNSEAVFRITQALGNFYRTSLSNGNDLIPLREEIGCIKNYMTIMNIRYDGRIRAEYDVQEDLWDEPVLKLILQPCVENAVQHGIRGKKGGGFIRIRCCGGEGNVLVFSIRDDGVGMSREKTEKILLHGEQKRGGFGIYSLIQRISLFYDLKDPVEIHSKEGVGTEIVIRVLRRPRK
jgi:two-component system sensor histidine kinase YesM